MSGSNQPVARKIARIGKDEERLCELIADLQIIREHSATPAGAMIASCCHLLK
jgi:hypothetical protein